MRTILLILCISSPPAFAWDMHRSVKDGFDWLLGRDEDKYRRAMIAEREDAGTELNNYENYLQTRIKKINEHRLEILEVTNLSARIKVMATSLHDTCKQISNDAQIESCLDKLKILMDDTNALRVKAATLSYYDDPKINVVARDSLVKLNAFYASLTKVVTAWSENKYKLKAEDIKGTLSSAEERGRQKARATLRGGQ